MKTLGLVLATLTLMTAFTPTGVAPAFAGERPTATVCVTVVNAGVGCATGTLSHVIGTCASTCQVTLRADLLVTPVACGWIGWSQGNVFTCADDLTQPPEHEAGDSTLTLAPGAYQVSGQVCVTDPTNTVTVPCDRIWHNYVVPGANAQANAAFALSLIPSEVPDPNELGERVYEDALFIVYELT